MRHRFEFNPKNTTMLDILNINLITHCCHNSMDVLCWLNQI